MEAKLINFNREFKIGNRPVGPGHPCLVIAEAGVNHFADMGLAFDLVDMAAEAGADVLKIQHYKVEDLISSVASEWQERLRSKELTNDQVLEIQEYCGKKKILFLCTGHDEGAIEFLDKTAGVPAFKVGSGEVHNWPSIQKLANRGKPIILSTGMYNLEEIKQAVEAVVQGGGVNLALLHCITSYPTEPADVNLSVMSQIRSFFPGPVGYSDHTVGTAVPLAAVALGADIIEKHITILTDVPNAQDWKVSCTPESFTSFVADIRAIEAARGGDEKSLAKAEYASLEWARKSLAAAHDLSSGKIISEADLLALRPGTGIPPSEISKLIGRRLCRSINKGSLLSMDDFEV